MAGLIRLGAVRALANAPTRTALKPRRNINTSSKKTSVTNEACPAKPAETKSWVTYGYSTHDPWLDRLGMHVTTFFSVSVCLVVGAMYLVHAPDPRCKEWAQREGYLELRRRERLGLPPIDADYHDPATIILPSDEELGDREIII